MSYVPVRRPRHIDLEVRGLRHHLTWWGEPTDSPVVLLHGFRDCGATWQFLVDCLPSHWSLVAPDWRGFGASEPAPQGYWFPDYLADLEAMLDVLVPNGPARLIGHSMGANVAGLYCGVRPQRPKWLVNLEGVGLPRTTADQAPERYARWLDELKQPLHEGAYPSVNRLAQLLRERNPRLTPDRAEFIASAWTTGNSATDSVQLAFDPRHRLVNPVLYRREEAEACWRCIRAPVLLMVGGESEHLTRAGFDRNSADLYELFRNLQVTTLPHVGHMMHHEDPGAVARHIIEFDRAHP